MKLKDIAEYVTDKISSNAIDLDCYVTTDSLLQNKAGREVAVNLPPQVCTLTHFRQGDILIGNIRPYLKKIWMADIDGGCNADVLVIRAKDGHSPSFIYALLLQDAFYEYAMKGAKGSKMPRGDKDQIMRYEIPTLSSTEESIGKFIVDIRDKINVLTQINRNLEPMARQLYDYWFVQFDFPDENGKPYKSSGGKMAWDEKLKRDIPEDWKSNKISEIAKTYSGGTPTSSNKDYYDSKDVPWINSGELNESFITATDNYISEFGLNNSSAKIYPANSILVALYGATAGKVSFLSFEASSNQAVCGVIPNHANLTEYLYIALSSLCKYYISLSTGSARDNISQATVKDTLLLFPNNKILGEFHILASKIFDKIINCQLEILNLTKQRDELLPLMMSSQVSVMPSEVNCDLSHD